jgi:hypothetical protein
MSQSQLASAIISLIRAGTLASIADSDMDDHDPWNEGQAGANWCENEISLFRDLHEIAYPYREHDLDDVESCNSVADVHVVLRRCGELVLEELLQFCRNGGTSNEEYFELRDADEPDDQAIRVALAFRGPHQD